MTSRLIFVPSLQKYVRFREITNKHLLALVRSQNSIADSVCVQWDIIEDRIIDNDIEVGDLTIIDAFFIFLTWRVSCIGNVLETGGGMDDYIELTDWLIELSPLLSKNFKEVFNLNCLGNQITLDIPTLRDDMETQKYFLIGGSSNENKIKQNSHRHTICMIQELDGVKFSDYEQKKRFYEYITIEDNQKIMDYSKNMHKVLSKIALDLKIEKNVEFTIDYISSLIRFIFSGSVDNILHEALVMSKKCNIGYKDFLDMIPIEGKILIDFIDKSDKGQQEPTEDLTEEYFNQ